MPKCVALDSNGFLKATSETTCTDFVLMTPTELTQLQSGSLQQMQETLNLLFAFDYELFGIIELALILAFLNSHFAGRIVRWLGKK
ncbi:MULTISPECIES: hypothetical protein [unclassified Pseudoalteromonas]|uniref:hypothetical protein n=1 Tax=unclassified Pseudoalteromonas TaxID=194690 RepID=UPI0005AAC3F1|nr:MULTISPECIES: hypothetical protein [unclassified Pseudoalteromonas]